MSLICTSLKFGAFGLRLMSRISSKSEVAQAPGAAPAPRARKGGGSPLWSPRLHSWLGEARRKNRLFRDFPLLAKLESLYRTPHIYGKRITYTFEYEYREYMSYVVQINYMSLICTSLKFGSFGLRHMSRRSSKSEVANVKGAAATFEAPACIVDWGRRAEKIDFFAIFLY